MASKIRKREYNIQKLLTALKTSDGLSFRDIEALLGCNRQSAHNYIDLLRKEGISLSEKMLGKEKYLYLSENDESCCEFIRLDRTSLIKYSILDTVARLSLDSVPVTSEAIAQELGVALPCMKNTALKRESTYLNIKSSQFYRYVSELALEGDLSKNTSSSYDSQTGQNERCNEFKLNFHDFEPMLYIDSQMERVEEFITTFLQLPKDFPYYSELKSIYDKLSILNEDTSSDDLFLSYGRRRTSYEERVNFLNYLNQFPYQTNALKIMLKNSNATEYHSIALILYSDEKDGLYIHTHLLSEDGVDTGHTGTINVSSIVSIEASDFINSCYRSAETMAMFRQSTGVSLDRMILVKASFDNVYNNHSKLTHFCHTNPGSSLSENEEGELILETYISNLQDIAGYFRSYGKHCHVLEPEALKDSMVFSAKRALSRYEETADEQ